MNILLAAINAKYIHSNLAVYSLRAYARKFIQETEIEEYTINQPIDEIFMDIYTHRPDILCFSCYLWNISYVEQLIREIPKVLPDTKIWLGGPEVSYNAGEMLEKYPGLTGIICGEGEETFLELMDYYHSGIELAAVRKDTDCCKSMVTDLSEIRGIVYRNSDGSIMETQPRPVLNLSRVPFAYEHVEDFRNRIIYYESSRGCPFSCSYCLSSIDKCLRFRDLELVKQELQFFIDHEVPQVKFVDRTFNCRHDHAMAVWKYIKDHDKGMTNFHFEIAADLLNEEEIALIRSMRPGLIQLEIGIQSANSETISEIKRRMDLGKVERTVSEIRENRNVHQHLDLIAGLPEEDLDSFRRSYNEVFAMKPEQLQLGFLKVLEGTKMKARAERYGILCRKNPPYEVYATSWLSFGEVLLLKGVEEMTEIYYNSHQFDRTLAEILKRKVSPFDFFHELAVYYDEKGLADVSHGRMARYEILRDFLREKGCWSAETDQCMVFDLYARERLKSRPVFAADLTPYRERLKEYERAYGRKVHIEVFEKEHGPEFVLFDYDRRSPLTKEAYTEVLR